MLVLSQAEAKDNFLSICRSILKSNENVGIKDKAGNHYLVLTSKRRNAPKPHIEVSAQAFKDRFSRYTPLIRIGLRFRLSLRGETNFVYAVRDSLYEDAADRAVQNWLQGASLEAYRLVCIHREIEKLKKLPRRDEADELAEDYRAEIYKRVAELDNGTIVDDKLMAAIKTAVQVSLGHNAKDYEAAKLDLKRSIDPLFFDDE